MSIRRALFLLQCWSIWQGHPALSLGLLMRPSPLGSAAPAARPGLGNAAVYTKCHLRSAGTPRAQIAQGQHRDGGLAPLSAR